MNGILLIDKEPDWTSSDVVIKLRGILHEKRIGHAGTLDPMATGLLTVFVGRATRAVEFAEGHDKRYTAALRLGISTDTQDTTGRITAQRDASGITREMLENVLQRFTGEHEQIPPMYSAIKVNGKKLYEIARKGETVERKARPISIRSLALTGQAGGDWLLDIRCSKGTYVRTLCSDIGDALGCGGCMSMLRRTEAGSFRVENAVSIREVQRAADEGRAEELLLPVDTLFKDAERCTANAAMEKKLRCGNEVKTGIPEGEYRVYSKSGEFLLLGRVRDGRMKTVKSFFEV